MAILEAAPGSDVKRPWELARFHHALTLGRAYALTGDARYAAEFAAQVRHWLRANPYPQGIHWAMPMEVAVRAVNWITAAAFFADGPTLDDQFRQEFLAALYLHARHVYAHREWNPVARGNHYLSCVVGLLFLGVLFRDTSEGRAWLEFGRRALAAEMQAQVGEDGVAHEGSSGYHALVTELFLSAALLVARMDAQERPTNGHAGNWRALIAKSWGAAFAKKLETMFEFPAALLAGREQPPIWGDSDDERLLPLCTSDSDAAAHLLCAGREVFERSDWPACKHACEECWWWLGVAPQNGTSMAAPAEQSRAFPSAGFFFLASPRMRASAHCGPLGVNGWANHAHCDQLSFELSWQGQPVVVDPGTFQYSGDAAARNRFRSSRYHNSAVVDGAEQNRFWPGLLFRMVDDTQSRPNRWHAGTQRVEFAGEHSGYRRLPQRVTVQRTLSLDRARDTLLVMDALLGTGSAPLEWNFHLAPHLEVQRAGGMEPPPQSFETALDTLQPHSAWTVGPLRLQVWASSAAQSLEGAVDDGEIAPHYGHRVTAPVLRFACMGAFPVRVAFVWGALEGATETK